MDIAIQYITEAQMYLNDYEDITLTSIMMESDKDDVKSKLENNAVVKSKSVSSMKKAFEKLKEMIRAIAGSVKDFMDKMFMSGSEKARMAKFEEQIKKYSWDGK